MRRCLAHVYATKPVMSGGNAMPMPIYLIHHVETETTSKPRNQAFFESCRTPQGRGRGVSWVLYDSEAENPSFDAPVPCPRLVPPTPKRRRAKRPSVLPWDPALMDRYDSTMTPWYMDEGERERRAERFAIRAMLLQWIRRHMTICLTDMERDCVEAYYFQGRSYREAARDLHVHAATVLRTVRQAVRKLREAAEQDTMIQEVLRRHGGW